MNPFAIAGLGTSVIGNVVGGIQQSKIAKQQQAALNKEKAYNESLFNREYYQDVLKRSENQSFLRELNRNQEQNQIKAQRTAAITGATPEAQLAQKAQDSDIYASAVNRMAGLASQRKDQALADYNARRMGLYGMQNQIDEGKKAAWGTFLTNANNLGMGALSATSAANSGYDRSLEPIKAITTPKVGVSVTGGPKIPTKLPLK